MENLDNEKLYKLSEAGVKLGFSPSKMRQLVKSGELPARMVGNTYKIKASDLSKYIAKYFG